MNKLVIVVVALLALTPIVSSISCYVGSGGTYSILSGYDVCYSWTTNGVSYRSALSGASCSYAVPSGYSCCSSNLCNGAKINGVSILMASVAAMIALFRAS